MRMPSIAELVNLFKGNQQQSSAQELVQGMSDADKAALLAALQPAQPTAETPAAAVPTTQNAVETPQSVNTPASEEKPAENTPNPAPVELAQQQVQAPSATPAVPATPPAQTIYQRLDTGQAVSGEEILKAWDDGTLQKQLGEQKIL